MNIYGLIILTALLAEYILNTISDIMSVRSMQNGIPDELKDVCDPSMYEKTRMYTKIRTNFGIFENSVFLAGLLIFWWLGGFSKLDEIVRSITDSILLRGLLFIGILLIIRSVASLPFQIYSTFVIEEKFGFNKTTPIVFLTDIIKAVILTIVIGVPLIIGVLAFFEYAGKYAWLYCWIMGTIVVIVLQFIAPTWIMPLFNKFKPLEEGELRKAILEYARSVNFSLKDVFIMDGSRRSTKANAFFTGFGKNKRVALFDTLLQKYLPEELVIILAHEIGHYKQKHVQKGIILTILHMGFMFFVMSLFIREKGLFDAFFVSEVSVYAGLIFFSLLFSPLEFFLSIVFNYISRKHEFSADEFAVQTYRAPEKMIGVLKKLHIDNLSNLQPHPFQILLKYSHPPLLSRIRRIRESAKLLS